VEGGFETLHRHIVARGLCTACGTCAGACPAGALAMGYLDLEPVPELKGRCASCGVCLAVCPGAEVNLPELEVFTFGRRRPGRREDLGYYLFCAAAHAGDPGVRHRGASGGLVTSLLLHALDRGLIDCAGVAGFSGEKPWRTEPVLASTPDEIKAAAASKYACTPVNAVLGRALERGFSRIGVVGLPCHVHAVRKMQASGEAPGISEKITLVVGLFCAAQFYYEGTRHLLAEWCGIEDFRQIKGMSYRGGGWPGHFVVELKNGQRITVDRHEYVYHLFIAMYKRDRCEMCIDWSSELADLSVGDYWAPHMKPGMEAGTSTCIVRSGPGKRLFDEAAAKGAVVRSAELDPLAVASGVGFELKKHSAALRLEQRRRFGWPVPDYHYLPDRGPFPRERHQAPEKK